MVATVIDENRWASAVVAEVRHFTDGDGGHYIEDANGYLVYEGLLEDAPKVVQALLELKPAPWE